MVNGNIYQVTYINRVLRPAAGLAHDPTYYFQIALCQLRGQTLVAPVKSKHDQSRKSETDISRPLDSPVRGKGGVEPWAWFKPLAAFWRRTHVVRLSM